ncbi:UNKNOWN [Stylonychia lemnae]|uniref:Uncharacterized protein n=1 Tax=Stylonychia lemnae TaxID=5949 RepID=A0A077ZQ62_STYLE|nr:UNKNOWN [Stylonychia lemnae]|eukprot:CDW71520.1 UNKNOWN [Stylonychia lemnae]
MEFQPQTKRQLFLKNFLNDKENEFNGNSSGMTSSRTNNSNMITPSNYNNNIDVRRRESQKNTDIATANKNITGAHLRSPSDGKFIFTQTKVDSTNLQLLSSKFMSSHIEDNSQFTETCQMDATNLKLGDIGKLGSVVSGYSDNEIENVLIGSIRPSKQEQIKQQELKEEMLNKQIQDPFYCKRIECLERENIIMEQQEKLQQMEEVINSLQLKLMNKKGKIAMLKLEKSLLKKREQQMDILHDSDNFQSNGQKDKKTKGRLIRNNSKTKTNLNSNTCSFQDLNSQKNNSIIGGSYDSQVNEQNDNRQGDNHPYLDENNDINFETYEKRDRQSLYKKMRIRTDNHHSIDESQNLSRFGGGSPIQKDSINNLKLSKPGIPLGPQKSIISNPLLTSRNMHQPQLSQQLNSQNQQNSARGSGSERFSLEYSEKFKEQLQSLVLWDVGSEMDSPTRGAGNVYNSQGFNPMLRSSQNHNFFQNTQFNMANGSHYQQQQNQGGDLNTVYFEDVEVFDEFEKRFKDFLKSTPYIEQILQTSKEYRMIIESLNILARFNDELKRICTMTAQLAEEGKKLFISKQKGQQIIQKNRELRVQIKSLLKDQIAPPSITSSISGPLKGVDKNNNTKRELIKQRNYLMQENDSLTFKFKKLFLF